MGAAGSGATRLSVPVAFVKYPQPGLLAAAVSSGAWDVGLIGADPLRASEIAFTPAYLEIEATYLVPADSPIRSLAQVDRPGVRIAVGDKTAYDMYLRRTLQHATLCRADGLDASFELFVRDKLDALAGLKPRLVADQQRLPGSRLLDGRFTAIQQAIGTPLQAALRYVCRPWGDGQQQAIGTPLQRGAAAAYLREFAEQIRTGIAATNASSLRVVSVATGAAALGLVDRTLN